MDAFCFQFAEVAQGAHNGRLAQMLLMSIDNLQITVDPRGPILLLSIGIREIDMLKSLAETTILLALLGTGTKLYGQVVGGAITGTVHDETGAALPSVNV